MNTSKAVILSMSILLITACTPNQETLHSTPNYSSYHYDEMQYYTQTYSNSNVSDYTYDAERPTIKVPNSYHVGSSYSPTRAKDLDKNWVSKQNPQNYTILVADDEKPALVANKLSQLPKNDRRAEIQYQRQGKSYYQGVYGSYRSKEEAQKAFDALPEAVKQQAGIKNWDSVQSNISD